jgi:hypothetical protein
MQRYLAYSAFLQGELQQAVDSMPELEHVSTAVSRLTQAFDMLGLAEWWVLLKANGVYLPHDAALLVTGTENSYAFLRQGGFRSLLPYALRIKAMLEWHIKRIDAASKSIKQGLAIARRIGHKPEQARCLFWRVKIASAATILETRTSDLEEALRIFAALGAWPEHRRTQALAQSPHDRTIVL